MGLSMIISLYTTRVILNSLGVDDYGIYNVVGSVVLLFTFLQETLTTSTQRFLSYDIGSCEGKNLYSIYLSSLKIYGVITLVFIICSEVAGCYYVNEEMIMPHERIFAANITFQMSVLTTCVSIFTAAHHAHIIANEKFQFYAYIGIVESVLKLIVAFCIQNSNYDKLITYSILMFFVSVFIFFTTILYCRRQFEYFKRKEKTIFTTRSLFAFSSWGIFGGIANIGYQQGVNVIINVFHGVGINAAFGIANKINSLTGQLVSGYSTALNPQLIKAEADDDKEYQNKLLCLSGRISYNLLLIVAVPVVVNIDFFLRLWLGDPPIGVNVLSIWMIVAGLCSALSGPLWVSIWATGNIKYYQIAISIILLLNLPFSYICFYFGCPPVSVLWIRSIVYIFVLFVRLYFIKKQTKISVKMYLKNSVFRNIIVTILLIPICKLATDYFTDYSLLIISIPIELLVIFLISFVCFNKAERSYAINFINNKIHKNGK